MLEIVKPCPQSPYAQPQPSPTLFKPNLVPRGLGPSYLSVKKKIRWTARGRTWWTRFKLKLEECHLLVQKLAVCTIACLQLANSNIY